MTQIRDVFSNNVRLEDLQCIRAIGLCRSDYLRSRFMAMTGYFDDSGSHDNGDLCVLAGVCAGAEVWEGFLADWRDQLDHGIGVPYFKSTDAWNRKKQFKGWERPEVFALVDGLCGVIRKHLMHSAVIAMPSEIYRNLLRGQVAKNYDSPYLICFFLLLDSLRHMSNTLLTKEHYSLIFDVQSGLEDKAKTFWYAIDPDKNWIDSVTYATEQASIPIQAADLYAWRTHRKSVYPDTWHYYSDAYSKLDNFGGITIMDMSGNFPQQQINMDLVRKFVEKLKREHPPDDSQAT